MWLYSFISLGSLFHSFLNSSVWPWLSTLYGRPLLWFLLFRAFLKVEKPFLLKDYFMENARKKYIYRNRVEKYFIQKSNKSNLTSFIFAYFCKLVPFCSWRSISSRKSSVIIFHMSKLHFLQNQKFCSFL